MLKRSLSFLLALMLCLSMVPVNAMALDLGSAAAVGNSAAGAAEELDDLVIEAAGTDGEMSGQSTEEELRRVLAEETYEPAIPSGTAITLTEDLTVSDGRVLHVYGTLTVPEGITLTVSDIDISGALVVKGTLVCGQGNLVEEGTLDLLGTYKTGQSQWSTVNGLFLQVNDNEDLVAARSLQNKGVPVGMNIVGNVTLDADISLVCLAVYPLSEENVSLTIPAGVTLECDNAVEVFGVGGATATICINGTLKDYGEYFLLGNRVRLTGTGRCEISGEMSVWGDASVAETLTIVQMVKAPEISISCVAASGKPRLTWNAVGGAEKYEVWRAYSQNGTYYKMGSTSGTAYTNLDAVAGKTYYYKVRAISADGNVSDFSGVKNMTCDYARPAVSIGCDGSSGKPVLSWKAVSGATKYEIWRATGAASGTYTKLGTVTETTYADASAEAGSTYYYKVRALGSSSYATSAFSSVKSISCCARPVVSIQCKATTGKPVLSWKAVEGAVRYEVWRAYSSAGVYYKMGSTTGTTYTNTSAKANTTYYYKIRAIDANGNYASAFSKVKNMTCDCAMPAVTASTNSSGKPRLSWSAVDGAVKYEIWRAGYRNGTYTRLYTTTNTYFNNSTAGSGYTYFYKVRAIGSSSYATSAFSSIVSAKATK